MASSGLPSVALALAEYEGIVVIVVWLGSKAVVVVGLIGSATAIAIANALLDLPLADFDGEE